MTRALVLGGGGPVGIGWEAGLLVGLAGAGVEVGRADAVIGTSAGSVVGFTLASGGDLTEATHLVRAAEGETAPRSSAGAAAGIQQLIATLAEAAADPERADEIRARLGELALSADTVSEEAWLGSFAAFEGADWPATFVCTAVNTADGRFQLWDKTSAVDVSHAVASSCAVPTLFPSVTIHGQRWMDGGVRDFVNADIASGHDAVLAVSCTLLEAPEGLGDFDGMLAATRARLDGLRAGGAKVETIVPNDEMLEISEFGLNLMDFTRTGPAYEAGVRQGQAEAARIASLWSS